MDGEEAQAAAVLIADFWERMKAPPFNAEAMNGAQRSLLRKIAGSRKVMPRSIYRQ